MKRISTYTGTAMVVAFCLLMSTVRPARGDATRMAQLVPDANRPRKTDRTYVFSRAQFIYPLGSDRYLHRWVDRPLFVDPALSAGRPVDALESLASYQLMQKTVLDYGIDGFAFQPQTPGRPLMFKYTRRSHPPGFHLLSTFVNLHYSRGEISKAEAIQMMLDNPASFRIDGKPVITVHAIPPRADSLEKWKEVIGNLKKQFDGRFLIIPSVRLISYIHFSQDGHDMLWLYHHNAVTPEQIERYKEVLRSWLRISDGIVFVDLLRLRRRSDLWHLDVDFYKNFVIRIMKSVLAEPEFKDKYFGLSAKVGHENCTRIGRALSSDGTKTLRGSMEAALSARPDFIIIPEWDEQNENTSLRPTVYNGLSSMRIMRYYGAESRGQASTPLPNDDTSIPNLILSYRKVLSLGEKLEVEVLNVPDTDKSRPYTAKLILEDVNGKAVCTSPQYSFDAARMMDHTLTIPSESVAMYPLLRPRLEVKYDGREIVFEKGLQYIEIRPTWNWDYKWVKQPLRDLLKPTKAQFQVSRPRADGTRLVSATFQADEPLAYVEVLDDNNVVYSQAPADDARHHGWHESADQVIIELNWQSLPTVVLHGGITLQNAVGEWFVMKDRNTPTPLLPPPFKGSTLSLEGDRVIRTPQRALLKLQRSDLDQARLAIHLKGIYEGTIPVRQLIEKGIYGIAGPRGFNLVLSRYVGQASMPGNLNVKQVQFAQVPVKPDLKGSILQIQAIGKSGHIYRGRPVLLHVPGAKEKEITVFSESAGKPVVVKVQADRVPDIRYDFGPEHGSVLVTEAGRPFWGILGGFFAQATGRGGGNYGDDSAFLYWRTSYPKYDTQAPLSEALPSAPERVRTEDGTYALQFNGKSTFVTLPQGVISPWSGWTVEMDIRPDTSAGQQFIIGNRTYNPGSISIYTDKGILKADAQMQGYRITRGADSQLRLPAGKWSHLVIQYDQKTLRLWVDGKAGEPLEIQGPGQRTTLTVLGGFGKQWFKGRIKNLRIRQGVGIDFQDRVSR